MTRRLYRIARSCIVLCTVFMMTVDTANACRLLDMLLKKNQDACCPKPAKVQCCPPATPAPPIVSAPIVSAPVVSQPVVYSAPVVEPVFAAPFVVSEAPIVESAPLVSNNCCCPAMSGPVVSAPIESYPVESGTIVESYPMEGSVDPGEAMPSEVVTPSNVIYDDAPIAEASPVDSSAEDSVLILGDESAPVPDLADPPADENPLEPAADDSGGDLFDAPSDDFSDPAASDEVPAADEGLFDAPAEDPPADDGALFDEPTEAEPAGETLFDTPADDDGGLFDVGGDDDDASDFGAAAEEPAMAEPPADDTVFDAQADDVAADDGGFFDAPGDEPAADGGLFDAPAEEPADEGFDIPADDAAADDAGLFDAPSDESAADEALFDDAEDAGLFDDEGMDDDAGIFDNSSVARSTTTLPASRDQVAPPEVMQQRKPVDMNRGMREWTDNTGSYKTVGRLVVISKDFVRILKQNGKEIQVKLDRLSESDLDYVLDVAKKLSGLRVAMAMR